MSNEYFNGNGVPQNSGPGVAIDVRAQLLAVQSGFDKLPTLAGNALKLVRVNALGEGLEVAGGGYVASGSWTPVLDCGTHGDLAVTYTNQLGEYCVIGNLFRVKFYVQTSAFTHTTSAGSVFLTGVPITTTGALPSFGTMSYQGITKANYTTFIPWMAAVSAAVLFSASGSAQATATLAITDMPTGGSVILAGEIMGMIP